MPLVLEGYGEGYGKQKIFSPSLYDRLQKQQLAIDYSGEYGWKPFKMITKLITKPIFAIPQLIFKKIKKPKTKPKVAKIAGIPITLLKKKPKTELFPGGITPVETELFPGGITPVEAGVSVEVSPTYPPISQTLTVAQPPQWRPEQAMYAQQAQAYQPSYEEEYSPPSYEEEYEQPSYEKEVVRKGFVQPSEEYLEEAGYNPEGMLETPSFEGLIDGLKSSGNMPYVVLVGIGILAFMMSRKK